MLATVPGVDAKVPLEFVQLDTDPPTADIVAFPKASKPGPRSGYPLGSKVRQLRSERNCVQHAERSSQQERVFLPSRSGTLDNGKTQSPVSSKISGACTSVQIRCIA